MLRVWREVIEASPYFPRADELRASVRLLDGGAAVVMEGGNDWPQRTRFFESVPRATELWWKPANRTRTLVAQRGRAAAGASFAQVNARIGQALHEFVLDRARSYKPRRVIDGYAGAGATAIPLAQSGADVVAIEVDRDASAFCASRLPHGSRALAARVEDVLAAALPADVVLLNPPRTGVHELVSATLESVEPRPRAIIYVSCDPATLARDLSRLPGYRVAALRAFDMFPQTAHVETVCELVPDAA